MKKNDPFDVENPFELSRFVIAQADEFTTALAEIRAGRKQSHWMWYIFPQFDGLGFSAMSKEYAIKSLEEARAYLAHSILGPRLMQCCAATLEIEGKSATQIFGSPDDMKLRSSMTLFARVSPAESIFKGVLDQYFEGRTDPVTLRLIAADM